MAKIKTKKKVQEEPKKSKKIKKVKETKYISDEALEIRRFIIILLVVIIVVIGGYFVSKVVVKKQAEENNSSSSEVNISYDNVSVGMILNRPYDEYYVMVYDYNDTSSAYYNTLASGYINKENSHKVYFCNLSDTLNEKYKSDNEEGNSKAKSIKDFKFGKITLLKIENGKVAKYLNNEFDIKKELK